MNPITVSSKRNLHAVRTAYLVLFLAAGAGWVFAGPPPSTPPFVQQGSVVTTPGATGVYNNSTFQNGANPFTVTISPALGQATTLNNGSSIVLVGDGSTIKVAPGVTLNQTAGGTAVLDINGSGTITNAGTVTSTAFDAIDIAGNGTVNNSGTLTGENFGINIGGNGTVSSTNTITANGNTGINIGGNGTVTLGATLTAENYGINIGGNGTVTVSSALTTNGNSAINIDGNGTVTLTAAVTSEDYPVYIGGNGTVTNSSTVTGIGNDAVYIGGNGTVNNTGTMTSNHDSAIVINGVGNVTNSGLLQGANNNGVNIGGSSTVFSTLDNTSTGTITGNTAIYITGLANVTNAGTVTSTGNSGIIVEGSVNGTSSVNNSGIINSSVNGIFISNTSNVTNSGTINAGTNGVWMDGTGTFTDNGGTITGGTNGVYIDTTGATLVLNGGSITGTSTDGLYLTGNDTVIQAAGSSVTGGNNGIYIPGNGTVTTGGSIVAQNNVGLYIGGTGTIAVTPTGSIIGAWNGIEDDGSGSLSNSGAIVGQGNFGVYFGGTGNVVLAGGMISGPGSAISTNSAASSVTVFGRALLLNGTGGMGLIANNTGTGSIILNLVGLTPAQLATFNSLVGHTSGDFLAGGETYDWENFTLSGRPTSLELVVDSGLVAAGTRIDSLTTPLPLAFDPFYLAAVGNPEAAMNELLGREINQGIDTLGVNLNTTLASDLNEHLDNITTGGPVGGVNVGGLHVSDGGSLVAFSDTGAQLDSLLQMTGSSAMGGTELSTDATCPACCCCASQPSWGVWASGNVSLADESGTNTLSGFHATLGSPTFGFDYRVTPTLVLGLLASYTTGSANFDDGSTIGLNTEIGALYGTWRDGNWHVNGIAGAGTSQFNDTRTTFGGATASSSPRGDDILTDWTAGYDFHLADRWSITPEAGLQYTHLDVNSFTESGAGVFDLSEGSQGIDSLRSHVGFKANKAYSLGRDLTFIPELRALWYHEFMDDSRGVNTSLPGAPALGSFPVSTFSPQRDFALVGIGLNTAFTGYKGVPVGMFINYNVQVGQSDYIANSVNAGIRVNF